ncbi:MAG: hypothetical protein AAF990_21960 [Bacteroidota bacterium]
MAKYILTTMFLGLLTLVFYYPNTVSEFDNYEFQAPQEQVIQIEQKEKTSPVAIAPTDERYPANQLQSENDIAATDSPLTTRP